MSIKYTASYNGQKFVRRSKRDASRPYTHVVIGLRVREVDVENAITIYDYEVENWLDRVNRRNTLPLSEAFSARYFSSTVQAEKEAEFLRETSLTLEEFCQERINNRLIVIEETDYSKYIQFGWAGRPDLAAKLVESSRRPYYKDVRAVPAE